MMKRANFIIRRKENLKVNKLAKLLKIKLETIINVVNQQTKSHTLIMIYMFQIIKREKKICTKKEWFFF